MLERINETRNITWHESCKCICRFTKAVCNNKQKWNENKCKCACKEDLIDKLVCDEEYNGILVLVHVIVINIVKLDNI